MTITTAISSTITSIRNSIIPAIMYMYLRSVRNDSAAVSSVLPPLLATPLVVCGSEVDETVVVGLLEEIGAGIVEVVVTTIGLILNGLEEVVTELLME